MSTPGEHGRVYPGPRAGTDPNAHSGSDRGAHGGINQGAHGGINQGVHGGSSQSANTNPDYGARDEDNSGHQSNHGQGSETSQGSSSLPARVEEPNLLIASLSGRQVAALRRRDAKDVSFVDCLVLPVEALQATPNSVGPYTFPNAEEAQAFIDETLETLRVLGCAIQRTEEHVRA